MARHFRSLAAVLVILMSQLALGNSKKLEEYWPVTGLDWSVLFESDLMTEDNCRASFEKFVGCLLLTESIYYQVSTAPGSKNEGSAVVFLQNSLEKKSREGWTFVKDEYVGRQLKAGIVQRQNSPVELSTKVDAYRLKKERSKESLSRIREVFDRPSDRDSAVREMIDILDLTKSKADQNRVSEGSLKIMIADAVNSYYGAALDPHSRIAPLQQMIDENRNSGSEFRGIGVVWVMDGKRVRILELLPGAPAMRAGLQVGDQVTSVNGQSTGDLNEVQVRDLILSVKDDLVQVGIRRGDQDINFSVKREDVEILNLTPSTGFWGGRKFGLLKLNSFASPLDCLQLRQNLRDMESEKHKGVILDLRNNPGGNVDVATCIVAGFVAFGSDSRFKGSLGFLKDRETGKIDDLAARVDFPEFARELIRHGHPDLIRNTALPMVVLVNQNSASASEIVAGVLQDYQRAWILGVRTFGKGNAQRSRSQASGEGRSSQFWHGREGVVLLKTNEVMYLPSGRSTQIHGVTPDFEVLVDPDLDPMEIVWQREEDRYPNAIPPEGRKWTQTRPNEKKVIEDCVKEGGEALPSYEKLKKADRLFGVDYQLMRALDVLWCEVERLNTKKPKK